MLHDQERLFCNFVKKEYFISVFLYSPNAWYGMRNSESIIEDKLTTDNCNVSVQNAGNARVNSK